MNGPHPLARFTVHLDADFGERVKNAAHAGRLSVAAFCVAALADATLGAEREHNGGQPFPPRPVFTAKAA